MQTFTITKGATSVILPISIFDSSSTTGAKLAGLVFNTASLTAYYNRSGAAGAATAITLATATKGTWATGGFVAIDGTNMPGDYELHIPDAALATGANTVLIQLKGAANMVPKNIHINLTSVDAQNATTGGITNLDAAITTRMATYTQPTGFLAATFPAGTVANTTNITAGTITTTTNLTNLPAAAALEATLTAMKGATFAGATDSLEAIRDRGDAAWITATGFATPTNITAASGIVLSGVTHTGAVIPTVTTLTGHTAQTGDSFARIGAAGAGLTNITLNAASIDLVWDEPTVGHATAGTTGKALTDAGSAGDPWSTALPGAYGAGTAGKIVGDNINAPIATVDTVVDAIKAKTDSLTFTKAGEVDSNIQSVNDVTIVGNGAGTPFNV